MVGVAEPADCTVDTAPAGVAGDGGLGVGLQDELVGTFELVHWSRAAPTGRSLIRMATARSGCSCSTRPAGTPSG